MSVEVWVGGVTIGLMVVALVTTAKGRAAWVREVRAMRWVVAVAVA